MAIKVKVVQHYFVTEVSFASPVTAGEIGDLMAAMKSNGKVVVPYSGGKVPGASMEQRTRIPDSKLAQVQEILGIEEKIL